MLKEEEVVVENIDVQDVEIKEEDSLAIDLDLHKEVQHESGRKAAKKIEVGVDVGDKPQEEVAATSNLTEQDSGHQARCADIRNDEVQDEAAMFDEQMVDADKGKQSAGAPTLSLRLAEESVGEHQDVHHRGSRSRTRPISISTSISRSTRHAPRSRSRGRTISPRRRLRMGDPDDNSSSPGPGAMASRPNRSHPCIGLATLLCIVLGIISFAILGIAFKDGWILEHLHALHHLPLLGTRTIRSQFLLRLSRKWMAHRRRRLSSYTCVQPRLQIPKMASDVLCLGTRSDESCLGYYCKSVGHM